jgi:hypothetical protein
MIPAARARPSFHGHPIDAAARNGRVQLVTDGATIALGKWDGERWVYACTDIPLDFTPTEVCRGTSY